MVSASFRSLNHVVLGTPLTGFARDRNSGRTRGIADMLGELGYKAFIPKILEPPFEGGTDGDGGFIRMVARVSRD